MNYPDLPRPAYPRSQKLFALFGAMAAFLHLCAIAAAQVASGAVIEGRVLNASTGTYLDKALVTVEGTTVQALTNEFGEYRLQNVPVGSVTLRVTYTGQAPQTVAVTVPAGGSVTQNIELGPTSAGGVMKLDQFVVAAERYKNAQELAINEERMSVNIKNVVAADSYGHIADGNIGEFVKFLPGIQVSYGGTNQSDADATGISIRGFGADQTGIMIDGAPVSNPTAASLTNQVSLNMLSVNNASRIEVIKVPTPDMPQDLAGGYVNIVSRSAFEYAKPTYGGRVYVALNSENTEIFKKTPGPVNKKTYKTVPGADFFVAYPITKTLGVSVSLFSSNQIGENHRDQPTWNRTAANFDRRPIGGPNGVVTNAAGTAVGLDNPYISRYSITDSPRATYKFDGSTKIDWRPTPSQTLSATLGYSRYTSVNADRRVQYGLGTAQDWSPTFVHGYQFVPAAQSQNGAQLSPGASMSMTITDRDTQGQTQNAALNYQFRHGPWMVKTMGSISFSRSAFPDTQNGHLSGLDVSMPGTLVGGMAFDGIRNAEPGTITVRTQAGQPIDTTQLANWALSSDLRAQSGYSKSSSEKHVLSADISRDLDFIPWKQHLSAKAGFRQDLQHDIKSGIGSGHQWKYVGTTPLTASQLIDQDYQTSPGYGLPAQQWVDLYKMYDTFKANPTLWSDNDPAVQVGNYNSYVNQQKNLRQTKNAWYGLLDGAFFGNKLHLNGGMRQSQNKRNGLGPFTDNSWFLVKNADGSFYRDAAHPNGVRMDQAGSDLFATTAAGTTLRSALTTARISYPDHVLSTTTLEGRMLQLQPNHRVDQKVTGRPTWSLNGSYDITSNLVAKVAWSRSEKQPPLENGTQGLLSGNGAYTITENTPPTGALGGDGTINVANPSLLPEESTSLNYVLNYYSQSGGKLGANYFTSKITNRHQTFAYFNSDPNYASLIASLGLDEQAYKNYTINTTINGTGTATNNGWEFEASQDFRFLGDLGRSFRAYASYTTKSLKENPRPGTIAFGNSSNRFGSTALFFSRWRISANLRATYTDRTVASQSTVAFNGQTYILYQVRPSVVKWDADFNYQINRRYSFFASGRDIFNRGTETWRYDAAGITPRFSYREDLRRFGVVVTIGVQGRF